MAPGSSLIQMSRQELLYMAFIHNIYPLKMFPVSLFARDESGRRVTWNEIKSREAVGASV